MGDTQLEILSEEQCLRALRANVVGRLAFLRDGFPVVLPVNYRLVEVRGHHQLFFRTAVGGPMAQAPREAALQIDGLDVVHHEGWSVLVQGHLVHAPAPSGVARPFLDPAPWAGGTREVWLALEPLVIEGRRLSPAVLPWAFGAAAYL